MDKHYSYTPTRCKDYPSYFEIPGYSRYGISPHGHVVNKTTGKLLIVSRTFKGYARVCVIPDGEKVFRIRQRHRLMAMAMIPTKEPFSTLVVNHRDGKPGRDIIDPDNLDDWSKTNLEWCTLSENMQHASLMGLHPTMRSISVRDVDTGKITKFASLAEAYRELGLSKDTIDVRARKGERIVYPERKQYREGVSDDPWWIPEDPDREIAKHGVAKGIMVRDVISGEITEFPKLSDCAKALGIKPPTLSGWIAKPNQPVLPGFLQLKLMSDPAPWREVEDPYLEFNMTGSRKIVQVVDTINNEIYHYQSAIECARAHGIGPTTLDWRLKTKGQKVYDDGCRYGYYPYDFD